MACLKLIRMRYEEEQRAQQQRAQEEAARQARDQLSYQAYRDGE